MKLTCISQRGIGFALAFLMEWEVKQMEKWLRVLRHRPFRKGIDAQASQGSVAPLTERSDETFSVKQFFSADRE